MTPSTTPQNTNPLRDGGDEKNKQDNCDLLNSSRRRRRPQAPELMVSPCISKKSRASSKTRRSATLSREETKSSNTAVATTPRRSPRLCSSAKKSSKKCPASTSKKRKAQDSACQLQLSDDKRSFKRTKGSPKNASRTHELPLESLPSPLASYGTDAVETKCAISRPAPMTLQTFEATAFEKELYVNHHEKSQNWIVPFPSPTNMHCFRSYSMSPYPSTDPTRACVPSPVALPGEQPEPSIGKTPHMMGQGTMMHSNPGGPMFQPSMLLDWDPTLGPTTLFQHPNYMHQITAQQLLAQGMIPTPRANYGTHRPEPTFSSPASKPEAPRGGQDDVVPEMEPIPISEMEDLTRCEEWSLTDVDKCIIAWAEEWAAEHDSAGATKNNVPMVAQIQMKLLVKLEGRARTVEQSRCQDRKVQSPPARSFQVFSKSPNIFRKRYDGTASGPNVVPVVTEEDDFERLEHHSFYFSSSEEPIMAPVKCRQA